MIDKNEMLQVFKEMLRLWELMAQSKDGLVYEARFCTKGFCRYLAFNEPNNKNTYLKELRKDLPSRAYTYLFDVNGSYGYWYASFYHNQFYFPDSMTEVNLYQLQPRIDHLKRTIARLENELKEQKNG